MPIQEKKYARPSNKLIIGGQEFAIDWPTFNFHDNAEDQPGFDGTYLGRTRHCGAQAGANLPPYAPAKGLEGKLQRYRARHFSEKPSYKVAKALIKQFVVHLDGCQDAEMCFNVLHNERGLSCHFILGNDGTLYQTLDLLDCAYHAQGMNETSIGIEICNRGNAALYPGYYDKFGTQNERPPVVCTINNEKYVAFDFTPKQYEGMIALGKSLAKLLPGIKLNYPQDRSGSGQQSWETIDPADVSNVKLRETFSGYLGHYHVTNQKWDPGPFDFKKFIGKLSGSRFFPMGLHELAGKAEVPEKKDEAEAAFRKFYDNNEFHPTGAGFFPVGPLEKPRLWHDGIHLYADEGTRVLTPFPGSVVAARNGPVSGETGSTNFVLVQHNVPLGGAEMLTFFSLYYHLAEERGTRKDDRPRWMGNPTWAEAEHRNTVIPIGEPVQAGEWIGRVGIAGNDPPEGQLHWEIFTANLKVVSKLDKRGFWQVVSGASDQRFCGNPDLLKQLDTKPKDNVVSHDELLDAYQANVDYREATHRMIALHYSEFSDYPDWLAALVASPEFASHKAEARELYEKQILPGLWLNAEAANKLGLPLNPQLYFFHPVTFLKWVNELLSASEATAVVRRATSDDYAGAKRGGMVDFDDTQGIAALSKEDTEQAFVKQPELRDLIDGYGD